MADRILNLATMFIFLILIGRSDCQKCTDFTCSNGIGCYSDEERCDQINQCQDRSDEKGRSDTIID